MAERAERAFYEELGRWVRQWQAEGKGVVIGGDFNAKIVEGERLHRWRVELELVEAYGECNTAGELATHYSEAAGGRRIDHILVSEGMTGWLEGGTVHTVKPLGHELDHRVVTVVGGDWSKWVHSGGRTRGIREAAARAREAAGAKTAPRRVMPDQDIAYQKQVGARLRESDLLVKVKRLGAVKGWGRDLWRDRQRAVGKGRVVDWAGRLVEAGELEAGCMSAEQSTEPWCEWVGWEGREVLAELAIRMTEMEDGLAELLVGAAEAISPQQQQIPKSRRRANGWFKGIGQYRRAIHTLNELASCCRSRRIVAFNRVVGKCRSNVVLRGWGERIKVGGRARSRWRLREVRIQRKKEELGRVMQGAARRRARAEISVAVEKREKAFQLRKFRGVIDSVLKKSRGGGSGVLREVEDETGEVHTEPKEVKKVASDYFEKMWAGGGEWHGMRKKGWVREYASFSRIRQRGGRHGKRGSGDISMRTGKTCQTARRGYSIW